MEASLQLPFVMKEKQCFPWHLIRGLFFFFSGVTWISRKVLRTENLKSEPHPNCDVRWRSNPPARAEPGRSWHVKGRTSGVQVRNTLQLLAEADSNATKWAKQTHKTKNIYLLSFCTCGPPLCSLSRAVTRSQQQIVEKMDLVILKKVVDLQYEADHNDQRKGRMLRHSRALGALKIMNPHKWGKIPVQVLIKRQKGL